MTFFWTINPFNEAAFLGSYATYTAIYLYINIFIFQLTIPSPENILEVHIDLT